MRKFCPHDGLGTCVGTSEPIESTTSLCAPTSAHHCGIVGEILSQFPYQDVDGSRRNLSLTEIRQIGSIEGAHLD